MKEEAPTTKKLPPKISATGGGTPVKNFSNYNHYSGRGAATTNDEILSTLLRLNNFDSISSIKDESLDIDLSACVTINADATAGMINANSLSSSDFWRVLDESAQNPGQLDMTSSSEEGIGNVTPNVSAQELPSASKSGNAPHLLPLIVKQEHISSFSGNFFRRPEPPTLSSISPLKKITTVKALPAERILDKQQRKPKMKSISAVAAVDQRLAERKKIKTALAAPPIIKQEPPEQLLAADDDNDDSNTCNNYSNNNNNNLSTISKHSFNMFMPPLAIGATATACGLSTQRTITKNFAAMLTPTATSVATICQFHSVADSVNDVADAVSNGTTVEELRPPTPEPLFKCEDCGGLVLHGLKEFAVHEAASHKILYKCNECQKDFGQEAALKKHVKAHRTVELRKDAWKKCPDCGKCLKLGSMWMHRKIHSDNKKYGCDICGQKFVQKINLTHHSRVHTSEKPYECPECQKRFQERSHLQRHQKYHAQTRSYRCEKCGKMYKTERCLKVHNLVHLEQRPFACNVCDKSFISNSKLKQHSNIHTGERPFKCNYCPRDFTNFPNWLKHTRRRHKVDHKTGEHLENIPSYCSKKPAKATAAAAKLKIAAAAAASGINGDTAPFTTTTLVEGKPKEAPTTVKVQAKRKKKVAAVVLLEPQQPPNLTPINDAAFKTDALTTVSNMSQQTPPLPNPSTKAPKVKRERKQPTPKQVQKPPATPSDVIKKEIIDAAEFATMTAATLEGKKSNTATTNFPDLHCLSITSAEELIMEQALEMEECGLYDAPASSNAVLDTDNAVSAESAAALHFQIKNEYIDIKEEFISLSETNNRVLCSSLESSPYSSPASIEFSTSSAVPLATNSGLNSVTATTVRDLPAPTISTSNAPFYMPSFRLGSGSIVTSLSGGASIQNTPTTAANCLSSTLLQSIQQLPLQQHEQQRTQQLPSAQALLNHLYMPISMNMPGFLMQPTHQQALPSVDTLLFTHANSNFFRNKSAAQAAAHHNL